MRQRRVPLLTLQVSDGLWLMNKAAHLQLEHFNKSNALGWAISMGLFAMPVIYSDREWNQIVGESYYIQLGPQDRFGWTEPEGKVYQIARRIWKALKKKFTVFVTYPKLRVKWWVATRNQRLASDSTSRSRKRCYAPTATRSKTPIKKVITAVSDAREDGLLVSVSGLASWTSVTLGLSYRKRQICSAGNGSPTLKRQVFQKLAFKYLSDIRQETKDQIAQEIDSQLIS